MSHGGWFEHLRNQGVSAGMPEDLAKRIRLSNELALVPFVLVWPAVILSFLSENHTLGWLDLGVTALMGLTLFFNRAGATLWSRVHFLAVGSITIFFLTDQLGPLSRLLTGYFPMAGLSVLLFTREERGWTYATLLLHFTCSALLVSHPDGIFPRWHPLEQTPIYPGVNFGIIFTFAVVTYLFFQRSTDRAEARLLQNVEQLRAEIEGRRVAENSALASTRLSALGEAAGGIAHEINNPLATITVRAEQLKEILAEEGPLDRGMMLEALESIARTGKRIGVTVRALKAFARASDREPVRPVALREVVADTLPLVSDAIKRNGIELRVVDETSGALVMGQATRLSQVVLNLLNNAVDAVAEIPHRWVEIRIAVLPGLAGAPGSIRLSVTDSGPGIPSAIAENLMKPFFTTKPVGKGTGLGLSLSATILREHGATLELDRGCANTRFVVVFPPASRS